MKKWFAMVLCLCLLIPSMAFADVLGEYPVSDEVITLTGWGVLPTSSMVGSPGGSH